MAGIRRSAGSTIAVPGESVDRNTNLPAEAAGCKRPLDRRQLRDSLQAARGWPRPACAPADVDRPAPILRRLMREFQQVQDAQSSESGPIASCSLVEDNLANWVVELKFSRENPLQQDLEDWARLCVHETKARLKLQVKFPSEYPLSPPEVWVQQPRLRNLSAPVSFGGKVCVRVLTSQGWHASASMHDVLLGLHAELLSGGAQVDVQTSAIRGYNPPPPQLHRLSTAIFPTANDFSKQLFAISASEASEFLGDLSRFDLSDKIALSFEHATAIYENPNLSMPLMFELKTSAGRKTHCGLMDFLDGLPKDHVLLPRWVMENLCVEERAVLHVRCVRLNLISRAKVQPHSMEFYEAVRDSGQDVRTLLTDSLRKLSGLTEGTAVPVFIGDGRFLMDVVELEPQAAVRVIDANVTKHFEFKVDFDPAPDLEDEGACEVRQRKLVAQLRERKEREEAMEQAAEQRRRQCRRMAFERRRDLLRDEAGTVAGDGTVEVLFRLPDGGRLQAIFHDGTPVSTLASFVMQSDWADAAMPWDVKLGMSFPKRTLMDADSVTRDMHRAMLTVEALPVPEGVFLAAEETQPLPPTYAEAGSEPDHIGGDLDWAICFERTRDAFERQRQLQLPAVCLQAVREERLQLEHGFLEKAKTSKWDAVRQLLAETPDLINVQPSGRWSALHWAAQSGKADLVQHLLSLGADTSARTGDGRTPVALATDDRVRQLLQESADDAVVPSHVDGELDAHQRDCVQQVVAVCGASEDIAQALLGDHGWDVQATINALFDG